MTDYLPLADDRCRHILQFVSQEGVASLTDLRREFMDVHGRELAMLGKKLLLAELLDGDGGGYVINREAFERMRLALGVYQPTAISSADTLTINTRILGQLYLTARNRDAYLALRRKQKMRWGQWCLRTGLDIKTPRAWYALDTIRGSGMIATHNAPDGDIILTPTSNRMAELYRITRQILGEAA